MVLYTPVIYDFGSHTRLQWSVLCKPPKRYVELVMLLSSGAAVMSCSFCPAGLSQVSWTSAALTWLAGSDISLPPEQFCWVSLRVGAKPCNWTRGCCWQVGSQWGQLSWSGIWREKKAVASGKESWQKQKTLMIPKLREEAHAAFYVWGFELLIKP